MADFYGNLIGKIVAGVRNDYDFEIAFTDGTLMKIESKCEGGVEVSFDVTAEKREELFKEQGQLHNKYWKNGVWQFSTAVDANRYLELCSLLKIPV
jgi:hypothetical protein